MFNPWKHIRLAACVVFLLAQYMASWALVGFGFGLLLIGIVGGLDLVERRIEKLEERNAKAETSEGH